ncbi:syntaxin-17 isoform X1 [Epargyreus clarus]|uniref:syntaxin-17 isoform X1 n=1 Tax=Epargyreus clarus TaxID=520877 RepID=UPI003C2AFDC1
MIKMEEEDMLPLKRVELSLTKFNEVAIPHHLDLLRQHRANILKYEQSGEYARVRVEQAAAARAAGRLRALLAELAALRRRVRAPDRAAFDRSTQRARDRTHRAVMDYLGVIERSCVAMASAGRRGRGRETSPGAGAGGEVAGSVVSTDSVGVVAHAAAGDLIQLQVDEQELDLREREAVLRGWRALQDEVRALHAAWQTVQAAALAHREQVNAAETSTEVAAENVSAARTDLALSERIRAGALGAGGALAGALAGGPLGLLLGAKAGAAALLAGSALGYLGARFIGRKRQLQLDEAIGQGSAGESGEGAGGAGGDDKEESRKDR